jgi:hypothetical protein
VPTDQMNFALQQCRLIWLLTAQGNVKGTRLGEFPSIESDDKERMVQMIDTQRAITTDNRLGLFLFIDGASLENCSPLDLEWTNAKDSSVRLPS